MSGQLSFMYPSVKLQCEPHIHCIVSRFIKHNNNEILNTKSIVGGLLKARLEPFNADWDYSRLPKSFTTTFSIFVKEYMLDKTGCFLSPDNMIWYNNTIDDLFKFSLYHLASGYRAAGDKEKIAIDKAIKWHGLDEETYSYERAHMVIYRFDKNYSVLL